MRKIVLTCAACLVAATLHAADVPIPADALVVVQLNGRGPVAEHVEKFLAVVQPDAAKAFPAQLKKFFADAAPGRDLGAIPAGERIVGMAFTFDGWNSPTPPWVWLVPVKDAAEFRKRLLTDEERADSEAGKEGVGRAGGLFLVNRPGFVAVSANEDAAKSFQASRERLTPERLGPLHAVVAEADASVYVNVANLNQQYGDALRAALLFAALIPDGGVNGFGMGLDPRHKAVVKDVFAGLGHALADGRDLAFGLKVHPEGLALRAEVAMTPGSPTAKQFAGDKVVTLDELVTLPAGRATYTASKWGPAAASVLRRLTREYEAPGEDDRAADAVRRYEEASQAAGVQMSAGGDSLLNTPDPAKLTAAHAKVIRTLPKGGFSRNVLLAERPGLREEALTAHGFTLTRAELALDVAAGVAGIRDPNLRQATLESVRRLVKERTVLWFGDDGKRYAQIEAGTPETAAKQLGAMLGEGERVGANAAFAATRSRLPKEASFVLLAEAGPAVNLLADYARSVAGALPAVPGFEVPEFRTLKNPPQSFVGVAATAEAGRVSLTVVVPAAAAKLAVDSTVIPPP